MALWNEKPTPAPAGRKDPLTPTPAGGPAQSPLSSAAERSANEAVVGGGSHRPAPRERGEVGESVIAANLTIEGKIEGSGNVSMAGRFKGDVRIDGNFTIDTGAHLTGQVLASIVVVGGELQGNIEATKRVDVLEGGVIVGDVKAGSITVAAGSRMRGHVEFGWGDEKTMKLAGTAT
ncbi:MAG: polymer-forming cytoskeletal protein [Steroidobacteraceae bacterium]